MIGRDYAFLKGNYQLLNHYAKVQFNNVSIEDFYRAVNESKPSYIRIEADMLIIIRYEIEKALFQNEIEVKDLPQI